MAAVALAAPAQAGVVVQGKVSWFGGPNDGMDSGKTALGLTTATPGVAIRPGATYMSGRKTLGGYWRITDPKSGRSVVLRQTDIGPNESTGRRIDLTYSALRKFGYSEKNFPTDSTWKAEYLGKNKPTAPSRSVTQRRVPQGSRLGGAVTGVDPTDRAALILDYARKRNKPGALTDLVGGLQAQEAAAAQAMPQEPSVSRSGGVSAPSGSSRYVTPSVSYAAGSARPGVGPTSLLKNFVSSTARRTRTGKVTVGTTTNHNRMTTSGNVSDHWAGNGADIPMPVDSSAGDNMAAHALQAAGLSWRKAIGMARQGGAWTITPSSGPYKGRRIQIIWKSNIGGNHHNHIHIGLR